MAQWGSVELGDSRRNEPAVAMGAAIAANPAGSLPKQMGNWNDLRAMVVSAQGEQTYLKPIALLPIWESLASHSVGLASAVT